MAPPSRAAAAHDARWAPPVRMWWRAWAVVILRAAIVVLGLLALAKIGDELFRLTLSTGPTGAIDLKLRHEEVALWFAGHPVYGAVSRITYPPATYALLWPFMGWLDVTGARWLWAVTSLIALVWLAAVSLRAIADASTTRLDRTFVVVMMLSLNAVGVTIGNGQLILHILPALLAAILLMRRADGAWSDALAALCLIAGAAKPTVAGPFLWVALFASRRWQPIVFAAAGYGALTWLAATFQVGSVVGLVRDWLAQNRPDIAGGYGDIQSALVNTRFVAAAMPAAIVVFVAHGIWAYRHRRADLWIQLGVAALVARLWAYHRVYDDVLIFVPMLALFRIARLERTDDGRDLIAGIVLALGVVAMALPARLETSASPWPWLFVGGHVMMWGAMLVVLMRAAAQGGHHGGLEALGKDHDRSDVDDGFERRPLACRVWTPVLVHHGGMEALGRIEQRSDK
jgi:hypothetical protein